eukprot:TRINITY_DN8245_c0_g4_i2.p1 TRINITY_DN8245_c0_g4~~TRINITY_DN8245_c0_g4_i2.p1  ORF type:complete len:406 (-),score=104.98 TRINITY_DN8245_c0_g4_i2:1043-2260(-)
MKLIYVIGCTGATMSATATEALQQADIVAAPERLMALTENIPATAEKIVLGRELVATIEKLLPESEHKQLVILASGDPLYHGIGATLLRYIAASRIKFFPAPTAFQQLFAALGQSWSDAALFSVHGGIALPYRNILRASLAAVYGDAARPAQKLAAELIARHPASAVRHAAAGCDLGLEHQHIISGTLAEIAANPDASASLSVLALLPDAAVIPPELPLGLNDNCYNHFKNMITHPEVRAIVVSKLRPRPGVMWDMGAGSGSVGLEAAGLCPGLQVYFVEKDQQRFEHINENIAVEGLPGMTALQLTAEEAASSLPRPDIVFIGGGGAGLVEPCFNALLPGGRLVITGVTLKTIAVMTAVLPEYRKELLMVNISRSVNISCGGDMLQAENPIAIAVFVKPEELRK